MSTMYAHPHVVTLDEAILPRPPHGWNYVNLPNPDTLGEDLTHYPVLLFGSYTYTAFSSDNNDMAMLIVAWDMKWNLVKQWHKPGARYIWQISFDADTETVTFTGQSRYFVTATLDELAVEPTVVHLPTTSGPLLPHILSYGASNDSFPVIKSGPYHFWPASYADNKKAFCVVVVDQDDIILKLIDCPGSSNIRDVVVNGVERTISLVGQDGASSTFDYNAAQACFTCRIVYTKEDFLFLAQYFRLTLSESDAAILANAIPPMDSATCCRMEGTVSTNPPRRMRTFGIGSTLLSVFLGVVASGFAGSLIGGPAGGIYAITVTRAAIGGLIGWFMSPSSDTGDYQLSSSEVEHTILGCDEFPCGPFDNTGVVENIFDTPFPRYAELPYSGAVARLGSASFPQAYFPAKDAIGDFPRDPRYNVRRLKSGDEVTKYIFVIVKTDNSVDGNPGYQMRINPEDFYPDSWPANQRVNHSQLSEGYRFWALVGNPHMQVYAAGSLYVDLTNKRLLGIDTRTGHYFKSFKGQDKAINDATFGFLARLGYDTASMHDYVDIVGYLNG